MSSISKHSSLHVCFSFDKVSVISDSFGVWYETFLRFQHVERANPTQVNSDSWSNKISTLESFLFTVIAFLTRLEVCCWLSNPLRTSDIITTFIPFLENIPHRQRYTTRKLQQPSTPAVYQSHLSIRRVVTVWTISRPCLSFSTPRWICFYTFEKKLPTTLKTIVEFNADTHTQYIYFQTRIKIIKHSDIFLGQMKDIYTRSMNARVAKCLHKYIYSTRLAIRRRGVCVGYVYIYLFK